MRYIETRRVLANPPLVLGLLAVALLIGVGAFGESLAPYSPSSTSTLIWRTLPDGSRAFEVPPTLPSTDHLLGTDALGRDQWSRILAGAWLTLSIVVVATLVRLALGIGVGIAAGWYGGPFAAVVRVLSRGVAAVPQLVLAILLVLVTRPLGAVGFIGSLAVVGWPEIAELMGAEARRARGRQFMEAARSIGASEGRLVRSHLLPTLGPQLLTLGALETGAVLLLLAELGIVGLFIGQATFFTAQGLVGGDYRTTPLMGRVAEWGAMLGAIHFYAISPQQLATLVPALFVALAAVSFTLLADGLRAASDPYGWRTLRPATFGVLSKAVVVVLCVSAAGFVGLHVSSSRLTMQQGIDEATAIAARTWPGSALVAAVARYVSPRDFSQPERLTYYFRNERNDVLRVTFNDADRFSADVRPYESQDGLELEALRPLEGSFASYQGAASYANGHGGGELRAATRAPLYRVVLTWPPGSAAPTYDVRIGNDLNPSLWRFCCFDARSGNVQPAASWRRD